MKRVIVLGAGLIGKTIAADLHGRYEVVCADRDRERLNSLEEKVPVQVRKVDFSNEAKLRALIRPFDLVIGAVPGFMGFQVLKTVIEEGKNVVDISFFPEDPFKLDALAKQKNVTAIIDCGVAPGLCNIIAGFHHARSPLTRYECLVGGLPVTPEWPFGYKAVFSPADVIEEYTRPARYVENGKTVTRDALTDIERTFFNGVGLLEAFNTDGLRTLAVTLEGVPDMKEKTLRYPGHAELMKVFRETGLFSKDPVRINGTDVTPLGLTSKLLFPKWELKPGEEDYTVMRLSLEDATEQYMYTLVDHFDTGTQTSSMARTTGYTCTAAATLLLEEKYSRKGICPPEYLGEDGFCYSSILAYLSKRNVHYEVESTNKKSKATCFTA